jgi:hypothetical protein
MIYEPQLRVMLYIFMGENEYSKRYIYKDKTRNHEIINLFEVNVDSTFT